MDNKKNKLRIAYVIAVLLVSVSMQNVEAQNTFFSISELQFNTLQDTIDNNDETFVLLRLKISDISLAATINIEMAEVMHDFTLLKKQGVFSSENGVNFIEADGVQQAIYNQSVNLSFKVPNDIIEKWKFTRVFVELQSGEESKYLYHRW